MVTKTHAYPDIAIPPGEYLVEEIEARGISQVELAKRMGRPLNAINEIVKGKKEITAETALQLEAVMPEIPARFWLNLEIDYQLTRALTSSTSQLMHEEAKMTVACWHHGDEDRLLKHLRLRRIDLYGPNEITEKGNNRLRWWWDGRMKLRVGDRVRIIVNGYIVAEATINGEPYTLASHEAMGIWGSAVPLRAVHWLNPRPRAGCAGHYQGSHRL